MIYLERTLILPNLEYGCEIYSSAMDADLRELNFVHHNGIRLPTGVFRLPSISSNHVDAGVHLLT